MQENPVLQGLEGGCSDSSGVSTIFDEVTGLQSVLDANFMETWLRAIALEEEGITARRADMWTMSGKIKHIAFSRHGKGA